MWDSVTQVAYHSPLQYGGPHLDLHLGMGVKEGVKQSSRSKVQACQLSEVLS